MAQPQGGRKGEHGRHRQGEGGQQQVLAGPGGEARLARPGGGVGQELGQIGQEAAHETGARRDSQGAVRRCTASSVRSMATANRIESAVPTRISVAKFRPSPRRMKAP